MVTTLLEDVSDIHSLLCAVSAVCFNAHERGWAAFVHAVVCITYSNVGRTALRCALCPN